MRCRYPDCRHLREPECAVKAAVAAGEIAKERYASYQLLYDEITGARIIYPRKQKHEEQ